MDRRADRQTHLDSTVAATTETSSHDDFASVMRLRPIARPLRPPAAGAPRLGASARRLRRRLGAVLLLIRPDPRAARLALRRPTVRGDELSDAKAQQARSRRRSRSRRRRSTSSRRSRPASPPRSARRPPAQRDQRRPGRGQGQDHQDAGPDRRGQGRLRRPGQPARPSSTSSSPAITRQEQRKRDSCAERKALLAERIRERLRHRSHVAAGVVPVRRHVHRPAGRDELLHRHRRAGQGPRRADRRRPGGPRGDAPDDVDTATGPRGCASRRPPRRSRSTRASRRSRPPRPQLQEAREADRAEPGRARRPDYAKVHAQQGDAAKALAKAAPPRRSSQGRSAELIRKQAQQRQHPVAVQRDARVADGRRRHPELRLHRVLVGAAATATAPTSTAASTSWPRTARRSARRAPGPSSTSAGTTPTAPTRPGS